MSGCRGPCSTCSVCASARVGSPRCCAGPRTRFKAGRDAALSALRRATVVASDETGVRIEGHELVSLGVPLRGRGGAPRRPDAGRVRGARDHGRAPARRVAVGPLLGPTGPRRPAADLPGPPRARRRLCARHRRRHPRLAAQAVARREPFRAGAHHHHRWRPRQWPAKRRKLERSLERHPRRPGHLRPGARHPEPHAPRPRSAPDLRVLPRTGRGHKQRL